MKQSMDAKLDSLPAATGGLDKVRQAQRRQMIAAFTDFAGGIGQDRVLDLESPLWASSGDSLSQSLTPEQRSGLTVHRYHHAEQRLPFPDGEFDWVFCHDVLAHTGSSAAQLALLQELDRVARKGLFVTAYNRRHPIDFYSGLPLLHWLTGKSPAQQGQAPALLDAPALKQLAARLPGNPHIDVGHLRHVGVKAQLSLQVRKDRTG